MIVKYDEFQSGVVAPPVLFEAPSRYTYRLMYGVLRVVTSAEAGSRLVTMRVRNKEGVEVFHTHAFTPIAASRTEHYYLMPGIFREVSGSTAEAGVNANYQMPIPRDLIIPLDYTLEVFDVNDIDAAGDVFDFRAVFEVTR